jgi:hypothetical protein
MCLPNVRVCREGIDFFEFPLLKAAFSVVWTYNLNIWHLSTK